MVTSLERRRPVAIDNIPSVRNSRFSRHFLATRETIFAGDDRQPFNVVKIRHTGPQCTPRAWERVQKTLSRFHFIYIEPQLGTPMLQFLEHLQSTRSLDNEEDEEDEEDEPDILDYPDALMSCPFCGRPFDEQDTLVTRGVLPPDHRPRPMGGV